MNIRHVRCIKEYSDGLLNLIYDNEYDAHIFVDGVLLLFIKEGWFKLTEWKEYLEVIKK